MITAKIIEKDNKQIEKIFEPEIKQSEGERASYKIEKKDKKIIFNMKAKDYVALRAILNSILKFLRVNEKINKLK